MCACVCVCVCVCVCYLPVLLTNFTFLSPFHSFSFDIYMYISMYMYVCVCVRACVFVCVCYLSFHVTTLTPSFLRFPPCTCPLDLLSRGHVDLFVLYCTKRPIVYPKRDV